MTGFFKDVTIDIPNLNQQLQLVQVYNKVEGLLEKINAILQNINTITEKEFGYPYLEYQGKDVPISQILSSMSGNSGLTQEYLYAQIQDNSPRTYRVLTGSINYEKPLYAGKYAHPKNSLRNIETVDDKEVIHVVRKGIYASFAAYFQKGNYTINDDAYLLYLKEKLPWNISLKWLMHILKNRFAVFTSSSDNKTWNKGKFFAEVKLDIPSIAEQNKIVEVFDKLDFLERRMRILQERIYDLQSKQIAQD